MVWESIRKNRYRLLLLALTLLGLALRVYRGGAKPLWLDEAFSIWLGAQPVGAALGWIVKVDQHPPLYYLLLHLWMGLGDGEATVRLLSALCSTVTIPVIYLLGKRLGGRSLGLTAALILAVSPFHVQYSQETRMYALLGLTASLAVYCLLRLLQDPRAAAMPLGRQLRAGGPLAARATDLSWLGYILFMAATLLTHNTAIFFPIAVNLWMLGVFAVRRLFPTRCGEGTRFATRTFARNWLIAQGAVLLLWLPWLPAFYTQSVRVYNEFWIAAPTWSTFTDTWMSFDSAFAPLQAPLSGLLLLALGALALAGLRAFRRECSGQALLLMLIVVPFAGQLLVSLRRPIFATRTLIWVSVPYYLLLAAGLSELRRVWKGALLVGLVAINAASLNTLYFHVEKEGWNQAAAYVAQTAQPGDLILFNATWVEIPFDYYYHRYDRPVEEHGVPVDLFDRGILEPKMAESDVPALQQLIAGKSRVWLVYSHNWYTDPQSIIPRELGQDMRLRSRQSFTGLQVLLYEGK